MKKPYSNTLISLLKGIIYKHEKLWNDLLTYEKDIREYFSDIYLELILNEAEGFAYLKQMNVEDVNHLKLIEKRQLGFDISLLCVLLREQLAKNDRSGDSVRAILSKDLIFDIMRPFYKETTNEANQKKKLEAAMKKVIEEGFLRKVANEEDKYEINRIITAFVNADEIVSYLQKINDYVTNQVDENE